MIFWTAVAALTVAVLGMICWPLLRARGSEDVSTATFDIEVYKSQLAEVDREEKRGSLSAEEAEAARAEIARRLLAADAERQAETASGPGKSGMLRFAAASVVVFVPVATIAFYLQIGKPNLPNLPYADRGAEVARAQAAQQNAGGLGDAAASLEQKLAEDPNNLDGWLLLARTHAATGRYADAVKAYETALTLDRNADILSAYGETLVFWGEGTVSEPAQKVFLEVLTSSPGDPRARFYLAQADYQAGRPSQALEALVALANSADAAAPWQPAVRDSALRIAEELGQDGVEARLPDPSAAGAEVASAAPPLDAETLANAENMSPEERQEMIRGMVESLAERLKGNPQDFEGWTRLIRALATLGDTENAEAALKEALGIFDRAPFPKRQLAGLAGELGLSMPGAADGQPGPTAEDVAAAAEMTPEERQEMIRGMVDGLAEKMKDNPQDFDGWMRLIRAYGVLGEGDKAQAALEEALGIFDRAPFPKRQLAGLAAELGLDLPASADAGQPGPSAEDLAAAEEMTAEERMEMITGMVDGLAERLKDNPDDLEGWRRLATSYAVLNRREEALGAFDRAIALAPQDSGLLIQKARAIRAFAGDRPTEESAALMQKVLQLDPNSIEALWFSALSAVRGGDKDSARGLFDRALAELPAGSQERAELKAQADRMLGE